MNSIGKDCNDLKAKYDACFQVWFSEKFLKGDTSEDMCKPLFIVYKDCVRVSVLQIIGNFPWKKFMRNFECILQFFKLFFQKALTEQNINLSEVDKEVLGTFSEKQDPCQNVKTDQ